MIAMKVAKINGENANVFNNPCVPEFERKKEIARRREAAMIAARKQRIVNRALSFLGAIAIALVILAPSFIFSQGIYQ